MLFKNREQIDTAQRTYDIMFLGLWITELFMTLNYITSHLNIALIPPGVICILGIFLVSYQTIYYKSLTVFSHLLNYTFSSYYKIVFHRFYAVFQLSHYVLASLLGSCDILSPFPLMLAQIGLICLFFCRIRICKFRTVIRLYFPYWKWKCFYQLHQKIL